MESWTLVIGTLILVLCAYDGRASSDSHDTRFTQHYDKDHPSAFAATFPDRPAWESRAQFLRQQVLVSQGLWPMPEKLPLHAVIHGTIDHDEYTVEKVFFASLPGHYVTGNLY